MDNDTIQKLHRTSFASFDAIPPDTAVWTVSGMTSGTQVIPRSPTSLNSTWSTSTTAWGLGESNQDAFWSSAGGGSGFILSAVTVGAKEDTGVDANVAGAVFEVATDTGIEVSTAA
jgi:hypothetical protein